MGSTRPQFFKVLLPGFLEKLSIPSGFAENLPQTYSSQTATILSPPRKFWQVRIKLEGCTLSFTDGWREFAQAHNFAVGFFLVFRYEGNMVFTMKVFGLNGCLKDYNDIGHKCLSMSFVRSDDEMPERFNEGEEHFAKDENNNFVEEKEDPLQLASATTLPLQFEKKIRPYNLKYKIMNIPRDLCSCSEFNTGQIFLLKDMKGRSWRVKYHPNGKDGFLRSGWDVFSEENNLELGDLCVFKFISKGVMHVEVVKQGKY